MKIFRPEHYPKLCFPNWFSRDHAETLLGRKLTKAEWAEVLIDAPDALADEISEQFAIYLRCKFGGEQ